jgi:hypothetical protein
LARLFFAILNLKFGIYLEFDLLELGICPPVDDVFSHKRRNESLPVADRRQDFTLGKLGKRDVLKNHIKISIRRSFVIRDTLLSIWWGSPLV